MESNPLVSVVVLSYERLDNFKKALPSIINQTYKNLEIIVVDNYSSVSDQIKKIVAAYNIRLVQNIKINLD